MQDICVFFKGNGISKEDLSDDGNPCILYGQLYTTYKNEIINEVISRTNVDLKNPFYSKKNDLIIPSSGEDPLDIAVARSIKQENVLLGGDLNILRLNKEVSSDFLSYQLNGVRKYDIARIAQGKSIVHLHNDDLKNIKVFVPPIEEQKKIAHFLSLLDLRIEAQIKIINNLKSQRKEVFVDFWRKSKEYKIKISDLGIVRKGSALSKNDLTKNGTPCILYGEIFTKYELIIDNIVSKTTKNDNALKSCGNDLIFPSSTTVDAISLVKPVALKHKNIILGGDLFSIRIYADKYDLLYMCCLINYVYNKKIAERCQGSTIIHLYYDDIKDIELQICDFTKQKYISTLIKNISTKIKTEEELLNKLNIQKSYLLRNLFI